MVGSLNSMENMMEVKLNKTKVTPVMDYRELNQYISSHTTKSEIYGQNLRECRKFGIILQSLILRKLTSRATSGGYLQWKEVLPNKARI